MAPERYVNHSEMKEELSSLKTDLKEDIGRGERHRDRLEKDIKGVVEKVGVLNDLVLPLTVSMAATAENTKEMAKSLKEFTQTQSETNEKVNERISNHEGRLETLTGITTNMTEKKKYNATILVALIGVIGSIVVAMLQLAPVIFQ